MDDYKLELVEIVRCKDCVHAPRSWDKEGAYIEWPVIDAALGVVDETCPYCCGDRWESQCPRPEGFCDKGERRTEDG